MEQKTYTPEEQAANSIKWLGELRSYKKTVDEMHSKDDARHCCLGVAACVLDLRQDLTHGEYELVQEAIGLRTDIGEFGRPVLIDGRGVEALTEVNDRAYRMDDGFENVHPFILENIDLIFVPKVATILKKHYGK